MPSIEQTPTLAHAGTGMPDTKLETVLHRVDSKMDFVSLDDTCEEMEKSIIPGTPKAVSSIGFAIDIDGVLFQNGGKYNEPLPNPIRLLTNRLYRSQEYGLTELRKELKLPSLLPYQLIHRLTPFKYLVPKFGHKPVLVIGSDRYDNRSIAQSLGFTDVYLPEDFYEVYPKLASKAFSTSTRRDPASRAERLRDGLHTKGPDVEISAILVFSSGSRLKTDEDLSPNKLLVQILKSHSGDLRIESRFNGTTFFPNNGYQQTHATPKIYYETCYHKYEDFRESLERDWEAETGRPVLLHQIEVGGEPANPMYSYADKMLRQYQRELHGEDVKDFERVVMIGDTPECDMRGANRHKMTPGQGDKWKSVLVASGSHDFQKEGMPEGEDRPDAVADDFSGAVISSLSTFGLDTGPFEGCENVEECEWQDCSDSDGSEDDEDNMVEVEMGIGDDNDSSEHVNDDEEDEETENSGDSENEELLEDGDDSEKDWIRKDLAVSFFSLDLYPS
ncbi:hypothetical protein BKA61DRAFT_661389 [Leptodontidium sp. MPI-SDFR-AT-0119]|nr:hypothetical protein BKA61DRAFT_661389 [Leptodontidium sp. MPI-SDFR-AT-0119]